MGVVAPRFTMLSTWLRTTLRRSKAGARRSSSFPTEWTAAARKPCASAIEAAQRADTAAGLLHPLRADEEKGTAGEGYRVAHHGMGGGGMGGMGGMGGADVAGTAVGILARRNPAPTARRSWRNSPKILAGACLRLPRSTRSTGYVQRYQEELRSQYSLGYTPDPPDTAAGYHKITN